MQVATVGFTFLNPIVIQHILTVKGDYNVVTYQEGGDEPYFEADPDANVVILPSIRKAHELLAWEGRFGRLIVLSDGRPDDLVQAGIPIVDAQQDEDDGWHKLTGRTPTYYLIQIQKEAVPFGIKQPSAPKPKKRGRKELDKRSEKCETLDSWLDCLDQLDADVDFSAVVEQPTVMYVLGDISAEELKGALKVFLKKTHSDDAKSTVKAFYRAVKAMQPNLQQAANAFLWPDSSDGFVDVTALARQHGVSPADLDLISQVYNREEE